MGVAVLVALGCVAAGLWQWSRHEERSAAIALVERNEAAPVVPIDQVLEPDGRLDDQDVWRHVSVVGRYVTDSPVLLRNRPVDGVPAYHLLTGMELAGGELAGRVLVVDRGWLPIDDAAGLSDLPPLPSGTVEAVVRLRAPERLAERGAPEGQVQALAPEQVRSAATSPWSASDTLPLYGAVVQEQDGGPAGARLLPGPTTDYGSHLSYAFQWWVFAVGALVGAVVLLRRDEATDDTERSGDRTAGAGTAPGRRRRATAEEEEDAILDAQEADALTRGR